MAKACTIRHHGVQASRIAVHRAGSSTTKKAIVVGEATLGLHRGAPLVPNVRVVRPYRSPAELRRR
eukprot:scaffold4469_cov193-Prasinococcus_capsulatus_cf.AAC.4